MAFDLTIGTEPAKALQDSIQDELQKRGFSPDADPVMAEYITIMLINNKTAEQITAELEDLIGTNEYDPSFTDWLFTEAEKKSQAAVEAAAPAPAPIKPEEQPVAVPETPRNAPTGPRAGSNQIYNQALNQALPSSSSSGHKRTASARSPSPVPGQPNKTRRMDLPTGPRALHSRDGHRTLLDRMGGRQQGGPRHGRDEIQARIDAVTHQGMNGMNGMNGGGFNNGMGGGMMVPGNDMAAAAAAMGGMMNPLALQEMMMNQMALMAQMANSIGLLGNQGQLPGPNGFPMNNGANVPFQDGQQQQQQQHNQQHQQRRGGPPGGRGGGKGPLKAQWVAPHVAESNKARPSSPSVSPAPATPAIAAPTPTPASAAAAAETTPSGLIPPARPQSPSLCKFGLKCTNALCRYSHPSPVATTESGVVLSNDHCEAGLQCKDKDCIKAHVSPAAVGVTSVPVKSKPKPEVAPPSTLKPPCRYGTNCTKAPLGTCPFSHPFVPSTFKTHPQTHAPTYAQTTQCRFGAACTRATCPFQHPPGRVLPGTFHRGVEESAPTVKVRAPVTGSMGASGPSPHKSVVFNKPGASGANVGEAGAVAGASKEKAEQKEGESAVVEAAA